MKRKGSNEKRLNVMKNCEVRKQRGLEKERPGMIKGKRAGRSEKKPLHKRLGEKRMKE